MSRWVSEYMNDALSLSLSEDNAVNSHGTSHDIDPMGKPLSLYQYSVCVFYCIAAFSGEEVVCSYEELVRNYVVSLCE